MTPPDPIQSAAVVGALQNVPQRSLALLSNRLSLFNSDRDTGSAGRPFKTPSHQTQTVRRRVANRLHLSDRDTRHAAGICKSLARDYLTVAETFAPVAECILFWLAFGREEEAGKASMWRDFIAIVIANLASFLGGEVLNAYGWFGLLG